MRKVLGESQFDYAIDFSGYSMFWANLILATTAKRKLVYLHSDIKADMENRKWCETALSKFKRFDNII